MQEAPKTPKRVVEHDETNADLNAMLFSPDAASRSAKKLRVEETPLPDTPASASAWTAEQRSILRSKIQAQLLGRLESSDSSESGSSRRHSRGSSSEQDPKSAPNTPCQSPAYSISMSPAQPLPTGSPSLKMTPNTAALGHAEKDTEVQNRLLIAAVASPMRRRSFGGIECSPIRPTALHGTLRQAPSPAAQKLQWSGAISEGMTSATLDFRGMGLDAEGAFSPASDHAKLPTAPPPTPALAPLLGCGKSPALSSSSQLGIVPAFPMLAEPLKMEMPPAPPAGPPPSEVAPPPPPPGPPPSFLEGPPAPPSEPPPLGLSSPPPPPPSSVATVAPGASGASSSSSNTSEAAPASASTGAPLPTEVPPDVADIVRRYHFTMDGQVQDLLIRNAFGTWQVLLNGSLVDRVASAWKGSRCIATFEMTSPLSGVLPVCFEMEYSVLAVNSQNLLQCQCTLKVDGLTIPYRPTAVPLNESTGATRGPCPLGRDVGVIVLDDHNEPKLDVDQEVKGLEHDTDDEEDIQA